MEVHCAIIYFLDCLLVDTAATDTNFCSLDLYGEESVESFHAWTKAVACVVVNAAWKLFDCSMYSDYSLLSYDPV